MTDPERVNIQNILTALTLLDLINEQFRQEIEAKKRDIEGISRLLRDNVVWYQDETKMFIETQLQKQLIRSNVLPELPVANEEWDYDEENLTPEATDDLPDINEEQEDSEQDGGGPFGVNYISTLSYERQRIFLLTSLEYFVQVLFDFGMYKLSIRNNVYYSAINSLQQAAEKFLKLILLSTVRRRYYLNQNNHILHHLAEYLNCSRKKELIRNAECLEFLQKHDQFFYSSLCVRSRYPPKTTILLFEPIDLPCHRFDKISAATGLESFKKIIIISSQVLSELILDYFPDGSFYLPSINAKIQLHGTDLYNPEDFTIEFLNK